MTNDKTPHVVRNSRGKTLARVVGFDAAVQTADRLKAAGHRGVHIQRAGR